MPNTPVVGQTPLSMSLKGKFVLLPLSALYFNDAGALKADLWPGYAGNEAAVDGYLARLRQRGALRPGATPPAKPAFLAKAASGGAASLILVTIANVAPNTGDPPKSTADVSVTETATYKGLQPATVKDIIGTAAGGGTRPGPVFVSSLGDPLMPKAGSYPLQAAAAGDPGTADIPKRTGSGTAFAVQTRAGGADAILTTVEIADVDTTAGTFSLIARWSKTAAAAQMSALPAAFVYAVEITAPPGGFLAPAAGTVPLGGGSDPVKAIAPSKATAIILAS